MIGPRHFLPACVLSLVVLSGAACGGGTSRSKGHITRSELAAMVLPKSALGAQAAALTLNPRSGLLSNVQTAAGQLDPRVTAVSLTKGGRLSGSALAFRASLSQTETALARGTGLLGIGSDVDLFRDNTAAAGQLARSLRDLRALSGKRLRGGAILERTAVFRVPRLADAARGMALTTRVQGFDLHVTQIAFRRGRLLAGVFEIRVDSRNVVPAVDLLARRLDRRIEGVLTNGPRGFAATASNA